MKRTICPVCGDQITNLEEHYEEELEYIDDLCFTSKRRDAAREARKNIINKSFTTKSTRKSALLDSNELLLLKVRKNKKKRAKLFANKERPLDDIERDLGRQVSACPICNEVLPLEDEAVNMHIDLCIEKSQNDKDTDSRPDWSEYTWDGKTRVRVTAMIENFEANGFVVRKRTDQDVDEEIDIDDEDEDRYGPSQYLEEDILATRDTISNENTLGNTTCEEIDILRDENTFRDFPVFPADSKTVIQALQERIKTLEKNSEQRNQFCLICLETYDKPVVSTQCWHVHCENCWLGTLSTKKLCPQCQKITCASDLRRIFL